MRTAEDISEYKHQWYEDNKDRLLENCRKNYEENRDDFLKKAAEYREKNREILRERNKESARKLARFKTYGERLAPYEEVQRDPENEELLQVKCKYDGRWFNPTNLQVRHRLDVINGKSNGEHNFYCSKACKISCPTYWKKDYPDGYEKDTSREVQPELRKMVLVRDNWTCQKCGRTKEEFPELILHCHHIFPLNEDPVGSADLDNCETLCKDCHHWVHMNVPGCSYTEMKC